MPQLQLPIFPDQCTLITSELAFQRCEDTVVYFNGHLPVFSHALDDIASFRLFTSPLPDTTRIVNPGAKASCWCL